MLRVYQSIIGILAILCTLIAYDNGHLVLGALMFGAPAALAVAALELVTSGNKQ